ncbi:tricarboxylate transport membrane protein TctA [Desulfocucumis palustris]|uniref:Tricarboxylate transport membrane protein TctA n=1 Tax=Desulfocucumis palustris TaxID=1898651 RepID=A0A2L2XB37_9FIRM|nr:tripartite tricarboxylate transporter permease [Desulfocucumis palustris]GBF33310.1 tricarboxylate transport membrane protein TctA [Desulfocucumis palustris]
MGELFNGFLAVFTLSNLGAIFLGIAIGIILGAIPGIGASAALAIFLPLTLSMPVESAILFLIAIYAAAEYGGSISAIIINAPGTGAAAATILDGYPMAQKGQPGKALGTSLVSSVSGGTISAIILATLAPPLALFGLKFGPSEMFALALCGIAIIASLTSDNVIKGWISAMLGLLLATVGIDPFVGFGRYTFDMPSLMSGISEIPVMIGLFALAEGFRMLENIKTNGDEAGFKGIEPGEGITFKEFLQLKFTILRSGIIGSIIGAVPGVGASVASFIAYDVAKRSSKTPGEFGKGHIEGVSAPEAANNALVGGALVPALSLGIPGSASVAILMGALIMHGLTPGPFLLRDSPNLVYLIFGGYFVGNFVLLLLGLLGIKAVLQFLKIPVNILAPLIIAVTFLGAYLYGNSYSDMVVMFIFGVVGWIFKKVNIPVVPLVIALILGDMVERNLLSALLISNGDPLVFVTRPISAILLIAAVLTFVLSMKKKQGKTLKNA